MAGDAIWPGASRIEGVIGRIEKLNWEYGEQNGCDNGMEVSPNYTGRHAS